MPIPRTRTETASPGRPNYVWDYEKGKTVLGRFGWKANTPTALQQPADAHNQDMGVTSPLFPTESSAGQPQADDPEINEETLDDTVFYIQTIAVPARGEFNSESRRGQKLFDQAGCSACHTPIHTTGAHPTRNEPTLNNQVIFP